MNVTLRPNRKLLDASFESYKLSLEKLPIFKAPIHEQVDFAPLQSSLSKQHLKAYSSQNCLSLDPFHSGQIYYLTSDGEILRLCVPENAMNFASGVSVCKIANWRVNILRKQLHASLKFPSSKTVVVYDGIDMMTILDANRSMEYSSKNVEPWKPIATLHPPLECGEALLLDAISTSDGDPASTEIHCLFGSVAKRPDGLSLSGSSKSAYVTYLDWLTYLMEDQSEWKLTRHRRFAASSFPDFVAFEEKAVALHICSERTFIPVYDSSNPNVAKALDEPEDLQPGEIDFSLAASESGSVPIHWSQTEPSSEEDAGSIQVCFELTNEQLPISEHVAKDLVQVTISPRVPSDEDQLQTLKVQLNQSSSNGDQASEVETAILLDHTLYGFVEVDAVWSIERETRILEVHLTKKHTLHWPRLLHDVTRDRKLVKHKYPEHTASEIENLQDSAIPPSVAGEGTAQNATLKPAFNVEQLEDVDFPMDQDEDDLMLQRIDGDSLKMTHQTSLSGHQWLFNVSTELDKHGLWNATSAMCLRHDVDGVVWLPTYQDKKKDPGSSKSKKRTDEDQSFCPWQHVSTLQAFGYVLASKRDHRFVSAPFLTRDAPLPFVAIADASRRIFVYRQPLASTDFPNGDTELRRRKIAKADHPVSEGVVHVAWQHVISLPENDEIIGFITLCKPYPACVACTENNVYLVSLIG